MRYLMIIGLLTFHISSNAQATEVSDKEALDKLEAIYNEYNAHKAHKFDFDITIEYPEREGEKYSGSLIEEKNKFVLDSEDRQIINDGSTVWVYYKERNEVEINDAEEGEDSGFMKPADIFDLYKSDEYIFAISNYFFENGQNCTQIECKPLDRNSEYGKIRLTISDKTNSLLRAQVFYKNGTRLKMALTEHIKGYDITSTTFKFDESTYEGIHVEDLRF